MSTENAEGRPSGSPLSFAEYTCELGRLQEQGDFMDERLYRQAIELGKRVGLDEILRQRDRYLAACEIAGPWLERGVPKDEMPKDVRRALETMWEFWL